MWQPCTFINQIITRKYEVLQFSYCFKESRTKQNMPTFLPSPVCVGVGQSANTAATTVDTQCVHLSQLHYFQPGEMLHLFSDKSSPSYQLLFNLTATLRSLATRLHHTQDRKTQTLTPP